MIRHVMQECRQCRRAAKWQSGQATKDKWSGKMSGEVFGHQDIIDASAGRQKRIVAGDTEFVGQ
jgi:hypothetical protein